MPTAKTIQVLHYNERTQGMLHLYREIHWLLLVEHGSGLLSVSLCSGITSLEFTPIESLRMLVRLSLEQPLLMNNRCSVLNLTDDDSLSAQPSLRR